MNPLVPLRSTAAGILNLRFYVYLMTRVLKQEPQDNKKASIIKLSTTPNGFGEAWLCPIELMATVFIRLYEPFDLVLFDFVNRLHVNHFDSSRTTFNRRKFQNSIAILKLLRAL